MGDRMKNRFTLVELLVCVAIIAIILGMVIGGDKGSLYASKQMRGEDLSREETRLAEDFKEKDPQGYWDLCQKMGFKPPLAPCPLPQDYKEVAELPLQPKKPDYKVTVTKSEVITGYQLVDQNNTVILRTSSSPECEKMKKILEEAFEKGYNEGKSRVSGVQ